MPTKLLKLFQFFRKIFPFLKENWGAIVIAASLAGAGAAWLTRTIVVPEIKRLQTEINEVREYNNRLTVDIQDLKYKNAAQDYQILVNRTTLFKVKNDIPPPPPPPKPKPIPKPLKKEVDNKSFFSYLNPLNWF